MEKYFSKSIVFISLLTALLAFIGAKIFIEFQYAVLFGLLFALGMMLILPLDIYFSEKKYSDIENGIDVQILLKENVNFKTNVDTRNGYVVLTENQIHFFSRDKKPNLEEHLIKENLLNIEVVDTVNLNIYISEESCFKIISANTKNIIKKMIELEWIKET